MKETTLKTTLVGIIPNGKFGITFECDTTFKRGLNPSEDTNLVSISNKRAFDVLLMKAPKAFKKLLKLPLNDMELQGELKYCLIGKEVTFSVSELKEGDIALCDLEKDGIKFKQGEKLSEGNTAYCFRLMSVNDAIDYDDDDYKDIAERVAERQKLEMQD